MTTKLSWAVTAGDQIGDSEDDQPCGNHFIDNDLECHDGDAHRPTPGKNPYFQGDRKGPDDKTKTPLRTGKNQQGHERDRSEHTEQNRQRLETLLESGQTPESLGREDVNHFADLWEANNGRQIDDQGIHDLAEMINQEVSRRGSKDAQEMGYHDPTVPKGPPGRQLWKQGGPHTRETEMPRDGGGMEYTPDSSGGPEDGGLYDLYKDILKSRTSSGGGDPAPEPRDEGPSREEKDEQEQWSGPGYQGEDAGPEPEREKGEIGPYEYQDRHADEWDPDASPEEVKDYQVGERRRQTKKDYKRKRDAGKAKVPKATKKTAPKKKAAKKKKVAPKKKAAKKKVAPKKKAAKKKAAKKKANSSLASQLIWANPMDVAEGRPCGDGEDPKKGKCNDGLAPPPKQQKPAQRPTGPAGRADKGYRMSDKIKGPAQEGIGLQPGQDAGREARMAQHVDFLSQDDGMDTRQTTNLMVKMLGGKPVSQPDGTTMVGSEPVATPQEAKQQNDDYRDTLTKTGWETYSEMGNKSVYKKGNTAIVLEKKPNGNQMKIKNLRPPAAPQRGRR